MVIREKKLVVKWLSKSKRVKKKKKYIDSYFNLHNEGVNRNKFLKHGYK